MVMCVLFYMWNSAQLRPFVFFWDTVYNSVFLLPSPSSSNSCWILQSTFLFPDLFSVCYLVSVFFCLLLLPPLPLQSCLATLSSPLFSMNPQQFHSLIFHFMWLCVFYYYYYYYWWGMWWWKLMLWQLSRDNAIQEIREDVLAKMKGLYFRVICSWHVLAFRNYVSFINVFIFMQLLYTKNVLLWTNDSCINILWPCWLCFE